VETVDIKNATGRQSFYDLRAMQKFVDEETLAPYALEAERADRSDCAWDDPKAVKWGVEAMIYKVCQGDEVRVNRVRRAIREANSIWSLSALGTKGPRGVRTAVGYALVAIVAFSDNEEQLDPEPLPQFGTAETRASLAAFARL